MTSILSSISGQFSKSLILGTLLPVVLFLILGTLAVVPLFPYDWQLFKQLVALDSQAVVVFTFATVVLSGLLYSFNNAIRGYYEGYPWKDTWVGQWRIRHWQATLQDKKSMMARTLKLRNELMQRGSEEHRELLETMEEKRYRVGRELNDDFPHLSSLVRPTRLGNVIRSSETYPLSRYNMDSIALWPRLRAKVDKDYAAALDDAKTPLDFIINISVLSAALALLTLLVGLYYPVPLASRRGGIVWGLEVLFFTLLSYLAYLLAIIQTRQWGEMYRGAFDLYRGDLLKQFGYKRTPSNMVEERALWGDIGRQIIYGDPPTILDDPPITTPAEYATVNTVAYGRLGDAPHAAVLQTTRGVSPGSKVGVIVVTLRVKNLDGQQRRLRRVVVRDALPDGYEYLWNSAKSAGEQVAVSGANPYYFEVGDLAYNAEKRLTYTMWQRK